MIQLCFGSASAEYISDAEAEVFEEDCLIIEQLSELDESVIIEQSDNDIDDVFGDDAEQLLSDSNEASVEKPAEQVNVSIPEQQTDELPGESVEEPIEEELEEDFEEEQSEGVIEETADIQASDDEDPESGEYTYYRYGRFIFRLNDDDPDVDQNEKHIIIAGYDCDDSESGIEKKIRIPESIALDGTEIPVEEIDDEAFIDLPEIKGVYIHSGIWHIGMHAIGYIRIYDTAEDESVVSDYEPIEDITIYCTKDSAAKRYAQKNGLHYEIYEKETAVTQDGSGTQEDTNAAEQSVELEGSSYDDETGEDAAEETANIQASDDGDLENGGYTYYRYGRFIFRLNDDDPDVDQNNKHIIITGYDCDDSESGTGKKIRIPESIALDGTEIPVEEIDDEAFIDLPGIKGIYIHSGIWHIGMHAIGFIRMYSTAGDGSAVSDYKPIDEVTIYCAKDSAAKRYAQKNGLHYGIYEKETAVKQDGPETREDTNAAERSAAKEITAITFESGYTEFFAGLDHDYLNGWIITVTFADSGRRTIRMCSENLRILHDCYNVDVTMTAGDGGASHTPADSCDAGDYVIRCVKGEEILMEQLIHVRTFDDAETQQVHEGENTVKVSGNNGKRYYRFIPDVSGIYSLGEEAEYSVYRKNEAGDYEKLVSGEEAIGSYSMMAGTEYVIGLAKKGSEDTGGYDLLAA